MSAFMQSTIEAYVDAAMKGATTADQGRALEDLICYVFEQVPGISIPARNAMNAFRTQEIDVALWNDGPPDGFSFLPIVILVECKNWSKKVSSMELNWFDTKLRSRGLDFGILVATNGITGNRRDLTAAHSIVSDALGKGRRLVVIQTDELLRLSNPAELVLLVKKKICQLMLEGTFP